MTKKTPAGKSSNKQKVNNSTTRTVYDKKITGSVKEKGNNQIRTTLKPPPRPDS